jgi:protein TonB
MQALLADDPREANELITQADAIRERALNLQAAAAAALPPPPPPPPPPPARVASRADGVVVGVSPPPPPSTEYQTLIDQLKPIRIGGGIKSPSKIRDVKAVYPPIAQNARVQGVVILEVLVDGGGQVVDARTLRSIPLLDQAAYDAVKQWEFTPTLLNGTPTPVLMTVTVNFTLQ